MVHLSYYKVVCYPLIFGPSLALMGYKLSVNITFASKHCYSRRNRLLVGKASAYSENLITLSLIFYNSSTDCFSAFHSVNEAWQ